MITEIYVGVCVLWIRMPELCSIFMKIDDCFLLYAHILRRHSE